jgi:hypothetical protein
VEEIEVVAIARRMGCEVQGGAAGEITLVCRRCGERREEGALEVC